MASLTAEFTNRQNHKVIVLNTAFVAVATARGQFMSILNYFETLHFNCN